MFNELRHTCMTYYTLTYLSISTAAAGHVVSVKHWVKIYQNSAKFSISSLWCLSTDLSSSFALLFSVQLNRFCSKDFTQLHFLSNVLAARSVVGSKCVSDDENENYVFDFDTFFVYARPLRHAEQQQQGGGARIWKTKYSSWSSKKKKNINSQSIWCYKISLKAARYPVSSRRKYNETKQGNESEQDKKRNSSINLSSFFLSEESKIYCISPRLLSCCCRVGFIAIEKKAESEREVRFFSLSTTLSVRSEISSLYLSYDDDVVEKSASVKLFIMCSDCNQSSLCERWWRRYGFCSVGQGWEVGEGQRKGSSWVGAFVARWQRLVLDDMGAEEEW